MLVNFRIYFTHPFHFLSRLESTYFFVSVFLLISAALSFYAWINPPFTLTFSCLSNIPYIRRNIVKENKSYVLLCRSMEVGFDLVHTYSWHFLTFIPFIVIFPYVIFSITFKRNNAGGSLHLEHLIVPVQSVPNSQDSTLLLYFLF